MFLVKAGTTILIDAPFGKIGGPRSVPSKDGKHVWTDTANWKPYVTKADKLYDKHEVWDAIAVHNHRDDVPDWAAFNITEHGKVILHVDGKYAMCLPNQIQFLD